MGWQRQLNDHLHIFIGELPTAQGPSFSLTGNPSASACWFISTNNSSACVGTQPSLGRMFPSTFGPWSFGKCWKTTRAVREVSHYLPPKNGPPKSVDCFLNSLQGEGVLKDLHIKLVGFSRAIQAFQFSKMFGPQLCFNSFLLWPIRSNL